MVACDVVESSDGRQLRSFRATGSSQLGLTSACSGGEVLSDRLPLLVARVARGE